MAKLSNAAGLTLKDTTMYLRGRELTPIGPYTTSGLSTLVTANLHGHTTESDGTLTPMQYVAQYQMIGFGALAITDHDVVTTQPTGITSPLDGCEQSMTTGHVGTIGTDYERGAETNVQTIINAAVSDGGFAILNHPGWVYLGQTQYRFDYAEAAALTGYQGLEIFNAAVITDNDSLGFQVSLWDQLLTNVRRNIWAVATDDFDTLYYHMGYNVGRVRIFVASNTSANVLASLLAGHFVADVSNLGVTPGYPMVRSYGLSVTCMGATSIRLLNNLGLVQETAGNSLNYTFPWDGTIYYRLEAVGDYTEGFAADIDWDRWGVNGGTWVVSNNILQQTDTTFATRFVVLNRHIQGDIEAQVDVRLKSGNGSGYATVALLWQFKNTDNFYLLRLAGPMSADSNTLGVWKYVFGVPTLLDISTFMPTLDTKWYTIKLAYTQSSGHIQAKVWETDTSEPEAWPIDVTDTSLIEGMLALRCHGAEDFDNLYIKGFKTYYQPIPVGDWT
jgi:hypothetical protein